MATTDVVKTIRMSTSANEAVKAAAAGAGISEAEFIRRALDRATWSERVARAHELAKKIEQENPSDDRESAWRLD